MTQDYLNSEIDLATNIFLYYTDKTADYLRTGSNKYSTWYLDSLSLYILLGYLLDIRLIDEVPYIGANEVISDNILKVSYKVREYYTSKIDVTPIFNTVATPITPSYIQPFQAVWKEYPIVISENNAVQVILPFNINIMEYASLQLFVNGDPGPNKTSNVLENGYHIIGNILYWHSFYNLKTEDTLMIRCLQIVG